MNENLIDEINKEIKYRQSQINKLMDEYNRHRMILDGILKLKEYHNELKIKEKQDKKQYWS